MKKYALVFLAFALGCAFSAVVANDIWVKLLAISTAFAFAGVGLAYAFLGPKVFFKRADGSLAPISYLVFWPYHLLNMLSLFGFQLTSREKPFDQIDENVYLGCRLNRSDEAAFVRLGICSVLDVACEFSELPALRQLAYRCIPVLDTCAPTVEEAQAGAQWIQQQSVKGPVYVHCALGHGRSATFVAAYLILSGGSQTAREAVSRITSVRPRVGLSKLQWALLMRLETIPN